MDKNIAFLIPETVWSYGLDKFSGLLTALPRLRTSALSPVFVNHFRQWSLLTLYNDLTISCGTAERDLQGSSKTNIGFREPLTVSLLQTGFLRLEDKLDREMAAPSPKLWRNRLKSLKLFSKNCSQRNQLNFLPRDTIDTLVISTGVMRCFGNSASWPPLWYHP